MNEAARGHPIVRMQIAMWMGGGDATTCEHCGHVYESVDNWIDRNPKLISHRKGDVGMKVVDDACWVDWAISRALRSEAEG